MDRIPRRDGRWRACSWLLLGELLLFAAGGALVLSPWWLAHIVRSPLVLLLLALPVLSWVVYGVAVLRACAVALPAPAAQGVLLSEGEAPALFAELKRLQAACDAPAFDEVYIDGRLNAAIYQTGRSRHVLIVGLPLLALLSPAQCAAVLVHEYAHISRSHGRLARWVYRARLRWQALESLHERNHRLVTAPLRLFLAWYVPRMLRETLAFSRRCEQVADALAVAVCGSRMACEAEVALALREKALDGRFWPELFGRAGQDDIEAVRPFERLLSGDADARPRDSAEATVWVHELLCHKTSPDDTHPAFAERVAATGVDPLRDLPALPWRHPDRSAAETWLGDAAAGIAEWLDHRWQPNAQSDWAAAAARHLEKAAFYRDLLQREQSQVFDASDWCRLASLAREFEEDPSIQDDFLRRGWEIDPEHPRLLAMQGDRLAERGDLVGAIALWTSIAEGPWRSRHQVHRRLSELHLRVGDHARAQQERITADALWQDADVGPSDAPQPHGLDAAEIGLLCRQLAPVFVHARALWLCRQASADNDEQTPWILFVQAFDAPLLRAVGALTGEKDRQRSACERLLLKLVPRLHLPLEVRMLGPRDAPGDYCNPASQIALVAAST
ncbi:hypothetical protein GCM10009429_40530 [Dyella marensis]